MRNNSQHRFFAQDGRDISAPAPGKGSRSNHLGSHRGSVRSGGPDRMGGAGPHHHGGRHRHRGRSLRPFQNGELQLEMLRQIAEAPCHGYELIKLVEDRLGGGYTPSPGIVYPTLTLLEDLGYVTGAADGARKLYSITEAGRAHLAASAEQLAQIAIRMAAFGAAASAGRAGPVKRAFENLKLALQMRLAAGAMTDAQIAAIAAVLDSGATDIEKI